MSHKPSLSDWLLLIFLALIWGSSFILMKKGLEAFRPEQVACFRIIITTLAMLPFTIIRWKEIPRNKLKFILLQGLFGNFFPAFLFTAAQQHVDSSVAGILNALSPVFVLLLGILFFGASFTWIKVSGMAVAFSGSVLLLLFQTGHGVTTNGAFGWLIVLATISYGLAANIIKRYLSDVRPLTIVAASFPMMVLPAILILLSTPLKPVFEINSAAYVSLGYIAILAVFGSAVASIIYNRLIHHTTTLFAASVTYLIPVVALFWGFLAGESIGLVDYAGMGLIFCGLYLVGR